MAGTSSAVYGALDRIENATEESNASKETILSGVNEPNSPFPKTTLLTILVLIGAAFGGLIVYTGKNFLPKASWMAKSAKLFSSETSSTDKFEFTMTRYGYGPLFYFDPKKVIPYLKYRFLNRYNGILEPYTANNLYIFSDSDAEEVSYYRYDVCSSENDCLSGALAASESTDVKTAAVTVKCNPMDEYTITIYKFNSDYKYIGNEKGSLVCMYVRREMRELTEKDLSDTMDAMKTLWDVKTDDGKKIYGSDYRDIDYLMGFHFFGSSWMDGDHLHEGIGFLPQHLKLQNIFEQVMRVVNPSVSLPFWDFTIEGAEGKEVWDSVMFTEKTFGSMPTPPDMTWGWLYKNSRVDDARIPNGRWKDATTGVNTYYPDLVFGYSYMRAPWSMNPSKYITRFTSVDKKLPTCDSHFDLAAFNSIYIVLKKAPYSAHAATHGVIGGVYGCDAFDQMTTRGLIISEEAQLSLCKNWLFIMKEFYRHGVVSPNVNCEVNSEDSSKSECGFTCDPDMRDKMVELLGLGFINIYGQVTPTTMSTEDKDSWIDFICSGDGYKNFGGDHLESASAADPSFWPIHPTLERLIQARHLAGGYENFQWPTTVFGKAQYVCGKANCFHSDTKTFYEDDTCCAGHFADSQIMMEDSDGNLSYLDKTNVEMMAAIDPTVENYGSSYIYSTFDWSHCDSQGVHINDLLAETYRNYTSSPIEIVY